MTIDNTIKSFEKFEITIETTTGDIVPFGFPEMLQATQNRTDQCIVLLETFDINKIPIDFDRIQRGDTLLLKIDKKLTFRGEILNKEVIVKNQLRHLKITAHEKLRLFMERQVDTVVYNAYHDSWPYIVTESLQSEIKEDIKPLPHVEYFAPQGNYFVGRRNPVTTLKFGLINWLGNFTPPTITNGRIQNDSVTGKVDQGVIFRATGHTLEKIWMYVADRGIEASFNTEVVRDSIRLRLFHASQLMAVAVNSGTAEKIPNTTESVRTQSGAIAQATLVSKFIEDWRGLTTGIQFGTTGNTLTWDIVDGINSNVTIVSNANELFGSLRACKLNVTASGAAAVSIKNQQVDPSTPSGWAVIQIKFQTSLSMDAEITVFNTNDDEIAKVILETGVLKLVHGNNLKTTLFTPTLNTIIHLYFRFDNLQYTFNFWHAISQTKGVDSSILDGENFECLNRATLPSSNGAQPRAFKIAIISNTAAAGLVVGWVSGNETGHLNIGRNNWCQFSLESDPAIITPGHYYAAVLEMPSQRGDNVGWITPVRLPSGFSFPPVRPELMSIEFDGSTWQDPQHDTPIIFEYADSWKDAKEGIDFTVDYNNKTIQWTEGTNREIIVDGELTLHQHTFGPAAFQTVRTSEYSNPDEGGIITPTRKMRLPDVIKHLASLITTSVTVIVDGNNDGTDDADGVGFNTTDFILPVFQIKGSLIEGFRDLAQQFNATIFMTLDPTPTFVFEKSKQILDFAVSDPSKSEYVLSMDRNIFGTDDSLRVLKSNFGPSEADLFTSFTVIGEDNQRVLKVVDWDLVDELGREIEKQPETFQKETNEENLLRFVNLLRDVHAIRIVEGTVTVSGFWPIDDIGRLDDNAIIRFINKTLENGEDLDGTGNVFRVVGATYNGKRNWTIIEMTNRPVARATLERVDELRNILNGIDPNVPNKDPHLHARQITPLGQAEPIAFMGLFSSSTELSTPGYIRQSCTRHVHADGFVTYSAFWPKRIGTVQNDQNLVDEIRLFVVKGDAPGNFFTRIIFPSSNDFIPKWIDATLHFTFFVKNP